ncbi:MAG: diaminopimelate epimerase [Chloroflexi bacterium]|nr:diaminopimelate epimerase [Chloroflexota bacterium]
MDFVKMQGAGNDFVVIDARAREEDWPRLAKALSDRHFGVGADGLLLVLPSDKAGFRMRIFNPDGSEAETCGNGLRCFAKFLADRALAGDEQTIETIAGVVAARILDRQGSYARVRVSMGAPELAMAVPRPGFGARAGDDPGEAKPLIDYPLRTTDWEFPVTCLSVGNPHAVLFLDEPVQSFPLAEIGPVVENHPFFLPARTNFEVVNLLGPAQLQGRVWERGAGETLACGSGACAMMAAARLHGYVGDRADVQLPGGLLTVEWDGAGEIYLTGPAVTVFEGRWVG